ncbi:MAG: hypothetical protein Q4A00_03690 [Flavobacteriaceae bacterium]|nr:hypothetical protein [Flavobacteriaceae bacterium]
MKRNKFIFSILLAFLILFSCNKKVQEEMSDLDKIRKNNRKSYPSVKMDSAQAIHKITQQKIQELLDLSVIYAQGNKNTEVDTLIYKQICGYFIQPDSTKISPLLQELDSLKVKNISVKSLDIHQEFTEKDTLNIASFTVEYFGKTRNNLGYFDKTATYILKKSPVKFVKEFKFYFIDFDLKEKHSSGVNK